MTDADPTPTNTEQATDATDSEALVEALVDGGVLEINEVTDTVTTTTEFEDTRGIYHDSYASVPDTAFHEAVADAFGFASAERAAERVDALGVTREQFIAFLALDSVLEESYTIEERSRMAAVVTELGPGSSVPEAVERLDDESYGRFVAAHDRAIVTVWKHHCDPCEEMKDELDAILGAIPGGVAVGGLDGENAPSFRSAYGIDAAPAMLLFEDGELKEGFTGQATPERAAAACAEAYES
jgi:thiol-disulfide isomerase/thioredoxin